MTAARRPAPRDVGGIGHRENIAACNRFRTLAAKGACPSSVESLHHQIPQKLAFGRHTRDEQPLAGAGAGDI